MTAEPGGPDDGATPADPIGQLAEAAAHLHEVYLEYIKAGFNENQALHLCGQILRGSLE